MINHKWNPVAQSLPERGKAVLVCMKSQMITVAYLKENERAWQVFGDLGTSFDENDEIHYWMPLPNPPTI